MFRIAGHKFYTVADVAKLRLALEPFAAYADPRGAMPGSTTITQSAVHAKRYLQMQHCYDAVSALDDE